MKKILQIMADNFGILTAAMFLSVLILTILKINPIVFIVLAMLDGMCFLLTKELFSEKQFKIYFALERILLALMTGCAVLIILTKLFNLIHLTISWIILVMPAIFAIVVIVLLFSDNATKVEQMRQIHVIKTKNTNDFNDGVPVRLCKHKESNEDVYISYKDRFLHMLIIGPTGCGKTSQVLIPMILQDIQNPTCGVTVLEPKGDLAEKVYAMSKVNNRPCLYFNPINPDCPTFNPLDGKEDDVIENMTTTFNMLTPDSKTYFQDMTDNLIRKSLMVLKRLEQHTIDPATGLSARPATLIELSTLIHNTGGKGAKMVKEFQKLHCSPQEKKQNDDTAAWFLDEYFVEKSKIYENTSGVRAQVAKLTSNKYLRRVLNPANGKSDINLDALLAEGGVLAITTAQGQLRKLGDYLGYFIILSFQSAVFKRDGNEWTRRPHYFYADEFQKYANPGFEDMLTQGRSFRVASHLATQARAQMAMGGTQEGKKFVEVVSTNARNVVLFPGISPADAEYYQKEFGEEIVVKLQKGKTTQDFNPMYGFRPMNYPTTSIRESEEHQSKYTATDIAYKEFGEITYKIIKQSTVQFAQNGIVTWIDRSLNDRLDEMVLQYQEEQKQKQQILDAQANNWEQSYQQSEDDGFSDDDF